MQIPGKGAAAEEKRTPRPLVVAQKCERKQRGDPLTEVVEARRRIRKQYLGARTTFFSKIDSFETTVKLNI